MVLLWSTIAAIKHSCKPKMGIMQLNNYQWNETNTDLYSILFVNLQRNSSCNNKFKINSLKNKVYSYLLHVTATQ